MNRSSVVVLSAMLMIAGCGQDGGLQVPTNAEPPLDTVTTNLTLGSGQLALHHDSYSVTVGEEISTVIEHLTYDKKKFPVTTLPARFENPPYTANGWESTDGSEGFGAICLKGQIAGAILRERYDNRDDATDAIKRYTSDAEGLTKSEFTSGDDRFIFWDEPPLKSRTPNRLMILVSPAKDNKVQLTIALGAIPVLDAIRVNEKATSADMQKLERSESAPAAANP
jgi:predicted small lipoprotein YifL